MLMWRLQLYFCPFHIAKARYCLGFVLPVHLTVLLYCDYLIPRCLRRIAWRGVLEGYLKVQNAFLTYTTYLGSEL